MVIESKSAKELALEALEELKRLRSEIGPPMPDSADEELVLEIFAAEARLLAQLKRLEEEEDMLIERLFRRRVRPELERIIPAIRAEKEEAEQ